MLYTLLCISNSRAYKLDSIYILNKEYFNIAPKLIWRQTAPYPICAIDYKGIWFGRSIQAGLIKPEYADKISYEYLCGLLNSNYIRNIYEQNVKEGGRVFPQVKLEKLRPLPIVIPTLEERKAIEEIRNHLGNIIAVGTTSVRTLESLYFLGCIDWEAGELPTVSQFAPYQKVYTETSVEALDKLLAKMSNLHMETLHASTQIMIKPGYEFRIINGMITNFHQPKSTLLLLVSAFIGKDWEEVYKYALSHEFRFLSYGDSSLLLPKTNKPLSK